MTDEQCLEHGVGGLFVDRDVDLGAVAVHSDALGDDEAPAGFLREPLEAVARLALELEVDLLLDAGPRAFLLHRRTGAEGDRERECCDAEHGEESNGLHREFSF